MNLRNVKRLRALLDTIYPEKFLIDCYFGLDFNGEDWIFYNPMLDTDQRKQEFPHQCNSVGCAIGWGTLDKDLNPNQLLATDWSLIELDLSPFGGDHFWNFMFNSEWAAIAKNNQELQLEQTKQRMDQVISFIEAEVSEPEILKMCRSAVKDLRLTLEPNDATGE